MEGVTFFLQHSPVYSKGIYVHGHLTVLVVKELWKLLLSVEFFFRISLYLKKFQPCHISKATVGKYLYALLKSAKRKMLITVKGKHFLDVGVMWGERRS